MNPMEHPDAMVEEVERYLLEDGQVKEGDSIVVVFGSPIKVRGRTKHGAPARCRGAQGAPAARARPPARGRGELAGARVWLSCVLRDPRLPFLSDPTRGFCGITDPASERSGLRRERGVCACFGRVAFAGPRVRAGLAWSPRVACGVCVGAGVESARDACGVCVGAGVESRGGLAACALGWRGVREGCSRVVCSRARWWRRGDARVFWGAWRVFQPGAGLVGEGCGEESISVAIDEDRVGDREREGASLGGAGTLLDHIGQVHARDARDKRKE